MTATRTREVGAAGSRWTRCLLTCVAFTLTGAGLLAADEEEQEKAETFPPDTNLAATVKSPPPSTPQPRVSARFRVQYDYRSQGDVSDTDLYGYLNAEARNLLKGHLDVYMSGRIKSDLDDKSKGDLSEDPFHSVDESNGVTEDRLLQLYGDIHDRTRRYALRLGRQYVEIADYIQLDGAQLKINEEGALGGRIYAGHPVSYYTSVSGDYAGGVSLISRPWAGGRLRVTASTYHDDSQDDDDAHYFVDARQQLSETARLRAQLSILNEEFRMGRADWYLNTPDGETDFALGASYWGSFDAKTRAYSPLYDVLGEQDPYTYAYARLTRQVAPHWMLSPGAAVRLADAEGTGYQNRDYENYDIALIFEPTRAFSSSLSLEYWSVEEGDSFAGVTGDLRYRRGRDWEISGGVTFAEYTYDTYSDISYAGSGGQTTISETGTVIQETPFVRTYYVRGKIRLTPRLTLRLQGDIEDNDEEDDLAYRGRGSLEVRL